MRPWRRMRGRFFWRIGMLFLLLFVFAVTATSLLVSFVAGLLGNADLSRGPVHPLLILLVVFGALMLAGRGLRYVAVPLGDMIEIAGRVAGGDYTARMAERGPTEVRAMARAFNAMVARLQANDEQRRNLLADVTHELRTPLTVIQGNLEGLVDGVYPRDDAHLQYILEETRVLSRLVDDLRTLALAESGALQLKKETTDLAMLVQETVNSFRGQADGAGIAIETDLQPDLPPSELDPARIRQVLENILSNALHFTPRGGTIRVRCYTRDGSGSPSTVSVSDSGAGISPQDLPHIFERFYKSADSRGTGLGLAIARGLVAAHGGEITAESEAGKGTTIRFTLPVASK